MALMRNDPVEPSGRPNCAVPRLWSSAPSSSAKSDGAPRWGLLGDQVDDAAAAAATEQDGGRSLEDLDPLDVVEIAEAFLVVPHAVDEEVRRGADAAQHYLVAVAFSLRDRDARHVPHRVTDGLAC